MNLVEEHFIKKTSKTSSLWKSVDDYCYKSKNLYNATQYFIRQCSQIKYNLEKDKSLDEFQQKLFEDTNKAIEEYNQKPNHKMSLLSSEKNPVINYNFLAWYMKYTDEFKIVGTVVGQQCLKQICSNWNSYFEALKLFQEEPQLFEGKPRTPRYLDKEKGRNWISFVGDSFHQNEDVVTLAKFKDIKLRVKHKITSVSLKVCSEGVMIRCNYQKDTLPKFKDNGRYYSIDLGINNLATVTSNTELSPFIINGRPLKSINQYYNKRISDLASLAKTFNKRDTTNRILRTTFKRNNLTHNYLHQASRFLVNKAKENSICTIIIGKNVGWKQECNLGSKNNQNFVEIPFNRLVHMISYKAELLGISVVEVEESYTSGTSYLDQELPIKENYNKKRRKYRGLFLSNQGISINADVNGSYQIMKKFNSELDIPIKYRENIEVIQPKKLGYNFKKSNRVEAKGSSYYSKEYEV